MLDTKGRIVMHWALYPFEPAADGVRVACDCGATHTLTIPPGMDGVIRWCGGCDYGYRLAKREYGLEVYRWEADDA